MPLIDLTLQHGRTLRGGGDRATIESIVSTGGGHNQVANEWVVMLVLPLLQLEVLVG
jgi:hypothetical protein